MLMDRDHSHYFSFDPLWLSWSLFCDLTWIEVLSYSSRSSPIIGFDPEPHHMDVPHHSWLRGTIRFENLNFFVCQNVRKGCGYVRFSWFCGWKRCINCILPSWISYVNWYWPFPQWFISKLVEITVVFRFGIACLDSQGSMFNTQRIQPVEWSRFAVIRFGSFHDFCWINWLGRDEIVLRIHLFQSHRVAFNIWVFTSSNRLKGTFSGKFTFVWSIKVQYIFMVNKLITAASAVNGIFIGSAQIWIIVRFTQSCSTCLESDFLFLGVFTKNPFGGQDIVIISFSVRFDHAFPLALLSSPERLERSGLDYLSSCGKVNIRSDFGAHRIEFSLIVDVGKTGSLLSVARFIELRCIFSCHCWAWYFCGRDLFVWVDIGIRCCHIKP